MDRSEAVEIIQDTLGFSTAFESKVVTRLQQAQEYLERNWVQRPLPWFLLTERADSTGTGDEERLAIPGDFIEEYEKDGLWLIDDNGGEHLLHKFDADDLREVQQQRTSFNTVDTTTVDQPTHYDLTGSYFRLFPTPSQVYTFRMIYYGLDATLSSDSSENGWLKYAPYALIGHAGERLAIARRDTNALQMFREWKAGAMAAFQANNINRDLANRRLAMGETI